MATLTLGVSTASTTNATSYLSGSFTPAASDLLVAIVHTSGNINPGTMSDTQSLGWTFIDQSQNRADVDATFVYVSNSKTAASSMTVTFGGLGAAASGAVITVMRVSGMTRLGSDAIRQIQTVYDHAATGGAPAPVFNTAPLTTNPILGAIGNASNPATMTPPSGWTEFTDVGYATPTTGLEVVGINSGYTTTTVTWGGSSLTAYGVFMVELDTRGYPPTVALNTADLSSFSTATPALAFTGTDDLSADVRYEVQVDTTNTFKSRSSTADSYSETNQSQVQPVYSASPGAGQAFTGNGQVLDRATFYLDKHFGLPTGNATAKIYAITGTYGTSAIPTGSALATSDVFDVSTLTTTKQLIDFTFSGANNITLSNGVNYFVSFEYSGVIHRTILEFGKTTLLRHTQVIQLQILAQVGLLLQQ